MRPAETAAVRLRQGAGATAEGLGARPQARVPRTQQGMPCVVGGVPLTCSHPGRAILGEVGVATGAAGPPNMFFPLGLRVPSTLVGRKTR